MRELIFQVKLLHKTKIVSDAAESKNLSTQKTQIIPQNECAGEPKTALDKLYNVL